jgi:hypothetical protein
VFTAHSDNADLNASQKLRIKNTFTSLALWTALIYQSQDTDPAVAGEMNEAGAYIMLAGKAAKPILNTIATVLAVVAVVAYIVAVVTFPPAMVGLVGIALPPVVSIATGISLVTGVLAIGFKAASESVGLPASYETPSGPDPVTVNPGDRGPAGGYLFAMGKDDGTAEWFEAAPADIGPYQMRDGAAATACEAYTVTITTPGSAVIINSQILPDSSPLNNASKNVGAVYDKIIDGWFLPNFNQLNHIYALYREGKINCQSKIYWSSTRTETPDLYYQIIDFYNGEPPYAAPGGSEYYVRPVRSVTVEEIIAFKNASNG